MPHLTHSLPAAAFPLYACLQSYNGPSLDSKLEAVTIDKSSVESAMASVLPPVPVATNAAAVPEVTSLPAPLPTTRSTGTTDPVAAATMAWVAGPVIGGVALVALVCGALYWWLARRSAQARQSRYHVDAAGASAGQAAPAAAGNPTEAASSTRAHASLQE